MADKEKNAAPASASGLYNSRWRRLRAQHLKANPLCVMCKRDGRIHPATEVDHIIKHNSDRALFFDPNNWQSLCSDHHRGTKARQERSGKLVGCDAQGHPRHSGHW